MTADSDGVYLGFSEGKFASHDEGHFDTVVIQKILDVFYLVVTPRFHTCWMVGRILSTKEYLKHQQKRLDNGRYLA